MSEQPQKERTPKYTMGIFFGLLSVFLALVVYATGQAHNANAQYLTVTQDISKHKIEVERKVNSVRTSMETYQAEHRASERAVIDKLDEVKTELSEQRKEQRSLLERILDLQISVAKKEKEG